MEQTWKRVLGNAQSKINHVYSATFFSKHSISIVEQQIRCFNLCYALTTSGEITEKSHVGIIGGGVSGMTCAVALAMLCDCVIYVFERDNMLLRQLREAAFRYIHPDLNPRNTLYRYEPHKMTNFAFMNWSGNYAPLVAEELARKFQHYRRVSNIALFLNAEIEKIRSKRRLVELELTKNRLLTFDIVIMASGFGNERFNRYTSDSSYWHSGNPRSYQPTHARPGSRTKERVLISGTGDSGVIELAHLLIRNFNHRDIFTYLPHNDAAPFLSDVFFGAVERLTFRNIEKGNENYPKFPGPISWYWGLREFLESNATVTLFDSSSPVECLKQKIYISINSHLSSRVLTSPIGPRLVRKIEKCLDPLLDELASYEIGKLVADFKLEKIFDCKIRKRFHQSFCITVIGNAPTIYSRRQAPLNWFLLRLFEKYGKFEYRRARIEELPGGEIHKFDRVIVRHGPDYKSLGYHKDLKGGSKSQYMCTHEPILPGSTFVDHFRTSRWKKAVSTALRMEDDENSVRMSKFLDPDRFLLLLNEFDLRRDADKLYRATKSAKRTSERLSSVRRMATLLDRAISKKVRNLA